MATIVMAQGSSSPRLFDNFSDDKDHSHFASWKGGKGTRNYHLILPHLFFIHT
jgi:hypothetical protein